MNGAADMGGMHGFGPVVPEKNEPVFHTDWEGHSFALNMVTGVAKLWNIDAFRFKRESLPPPEYLNLSYYGLWTRTLELMMLEYGIANPDELKSGHAIAPFKKAERAVTAAECDNMVRCARPFSRPAPEPAKFKVGDRVRARNMHPQHHTRLPRYARGHTGTIERINGCHVFPDTNAQGQGENPQWLYTVVFSGRDLWGADTDPTLKVSIEAFEPYLERA